MNSGHSASLSSEGAISPSQKDFTTPIIRNIKIIYQPNMAIKNRILDEITYEVNRGV